MAVSVCCIHYQGNEWGMKHLGNAGKILQTAVIFRLANFLVFSVKVIIFI